MTGSAGRSPGVLRLLVETLSGRRPIERSGPLLSAFHALPAPLRDGARWVLRPQRRFLLGRLRAQSRDCVMSGPFAGMQLVGHPAAPELLGTYERELADHVRALAARPFRTVVNVGARYGYYAVGMARLMPNTQVHAFETLDDARATLTTCAAVNGVANRVHVAGFCDVEALAAVLGDGDDALVVCDIEGGEAVLLDPGLVPGLRRAAMLVECHGPPEDSTERVLVARFLATHAIERIATETRVLAHLPAGVGEPWRSRLGATMESLLQEHRSQPQSWLLLMPRG